MKASAKMVPWHAERRLWVRYANRTSRAKVCFLRRLLPLMWNDNVVSKYRGVNSRYWEVTLTFRTRQWSKMNLFVGDPTELFYLVKDADTWWHELGFEGWQQHR